MDIRAIVVVVAIALGAICVLAGLVAFFRGMGGDKGKAVLKLPGIEISGAASPALFLIIGAGLVFCSLQWDASAKEVNVKETQLVNEVEKKEEAVRVVENLQVSVDQLQVANRELRLRVPPQALAQLEHTQPAVARPQVYTVSPEVLQKLRTSPVRKMR